MLNNIYINDLSNKQDKLTNPLTRSNIVNNLTSTSTTNVLSAAQGKVLKDSLDSSLKSRTVLGNVIGTGAQKDTNISKDLTSYKFILIEYLYANANSCNTIFTPLSLFTAHAEFDIEWGGVVRAVVHNTSNTGFTIQTKANMDSNWNIAVCGII